MQELRHKNSLVAMAAIAAQRRHACRHHHDVSVMCRGAAGTERVEFGDGVSHPQKGTGLGMGQCPLLTQFLISCLGMVHLSSIRTRLDSSHGLLQ